MPTRVTIEQARALTLEKQSLRERARGRDVVSIVRQVGPLHAKPATTPFLALWARMDALDREGLSWALYNERSLVRFPSADGHLYVVPADRMAAYRQTHLLLSGDTTREYLAYLVDASAAQGDPDAIRLHEIIPRVLEVVSTRGACTVEELGTWLPVLDRQLSTGLEGDVAATKFRLGTRLIPALCAQGLLMPAQPRGSWRSERETYTTPGTWLPDLSLEPLDPREALGSLLIDYVTAYGPVTVGDMVHWLGGARRQQLASALMAIEGQLARVEVAETRGEAWVLRSDLARLPDARIAHRTVSLLPEVDGTLMALRDASRFLPAEYRDRVYDWVGDSLGAVMVDGLIQGLWWPQNRGDRIVVRFFERVDPEAMALAAEEARSLGKFLEGDEVDIDIGLIDDDADRESLQPIPLEVRPGR